MGFSEAKGMFLDGNQGGEKILPSPLAISEHVLQAEALKLHDHYQRQIDTTGTCDIGTDLERYIQLKAQVEINRTRQDVRAFREIADTRNAHIALRTKLNNLVGSGAVGPGLTHVLDKYSSTKSTQMR